MKRIFDEVVIINLRRRPDRLERLKRELTRIAWPFRYPKIFRAIDGKVFCPPAGWTDGPGAWGCLASHRQVLANAIKDGKQSILVMEDDVVFCDSFRERIKEFLAIVPEDWEQLMIGGQHQYYYHGLPDLIKPGVYRCKDCERTHCYAVRGEYMRKLVDRWAGGGKFSGNAHCDWIMGRDPDMQLSHKVYAPEYFLAGQERGQSDIFNDPQPRRFWNPPSPNLSVVNLHATGRVAVALRAYGFYTGRLNSGENWDRELTTIFERTRGNRAERRRLLEEWIKIIQWELAGDDHFICTVWHPEALPRLVGMASLWPVYEISAQNVYSALRQLPAHLKRNLSEPL